MSSISNKKVHNFFLCTKRVVFNFGEFKSRKCLISFSRDYVRKGEKNKKALKNQGFSWLYLFYIFIALIGLRSGISCPVCFCVAARRLGTLGSRGSQRETSLHGKQLSTVFRSFSHALRPEGRRGQAQPVTKRKELKPPKR